MTPTLLAIFRGNSCVLVMKMDAELLKETLEPVVENLGFELAEISAPVSGGRLILRLFIHSPKGVNLDDCARVSRAVSDKLDADDPIGGRYTLEVSSLGLDKPLLTPRDFQRRIGEMVQVIYQENGKKKTVKGVLKDSDEKTIRIEQGEATIDIPVEADPRGKILV